MLSLLAKLGRIEQVFLLLLLLYGLAAWLSPALTGLVGLLVFLFGVTVVLRLVRLLIRKAIWRVRNRLIVSYLFIAVVPMTLMLALLGLGLYVLIGQMAVYAVHSQLQLRTEAAGPDFDPTRREFLSSLAPELGDVFLLNVTGTGVTVSSLEVFRREHIPPPLNRFDVEVIWFAPVTLQAKPRLLVVRSRPSAVLRSLFGQKMEWRQDILLIASGLGSVFVLAVLISIVIGVSITRSVTRSVHDLYDGTGRIQQGDFSHRIAVHGADQLAELSRSFNRMTGNLERLIAIEKERERLHSELEIAREVQSRLFPKGAPALKTLELTGACHAAQMVSGDYYDFLPVEPSRVALAIGDVAGKGISAALLMAAIQSVMRTQLTDAAAISPAKVVSLLNRQLYANTSPEKYATFYFGLYDDASEILTYTNAGHLPPILVRDGAPTLLEITGTVVGAFPMCVYDERQVVLQEGDLLVAYTDGIVEPENAYGEAFGENRLTDLLVKYVQSDAQEIIARTVESVRQWSSSAEQPDDMTMIVARRI